MTRDFTNTPQGQAFLMQQRQRQRERLNSAPIRNFLNKYPDLAEDANWWNRVDQETIGTGWEQASETKRTEILEQAAARVRSEKIDHGRRRTARQIVAQRAKLQGK